MKLITIDQARKHVKADGDDDDRTRRIVGFFVQIKYVFHRRDKLRADLGNTPLLNLPRFKGVFLKAGAPSHG